MAGKIYRRKKSDDFVTLDTHCLRNKDLKWDAKGLHSYLVQLPDDWQINISDLVNRSKDGRDATSTPMKSLIFAGYIIRERCFDEKGKFEGYDYFVFERPEHAIEWKTVNGKTVNGKTVNGKTVNGKTATNKYEDYQSINNTKYEDSKADKPHPTPKNEITIEQSLNEDPKKPNNFTGRGAAKKEKPYAPHIHAENEQSFEYFSDPAKAKAAWTEWIEYKYSQHRQKYKEAKSELTKLRQLFQQFNGDSNKFEAAINYSIGNLYSGVFAPKIENSGQTKPSSSGNTQRATLNKFGSDPAKYNETPLF